MEAIQACTNEPTCARRLDTLAGRLERLCEDSYRRFRDAERIADGLLGERPAEISKAGEAEPGSRIEVLEHYTYKLERHLDELAEQLNRLDSV